LGNPIFIVTQTKLVVENYPKSAKKCTSLPVQIGIMHDSEGSAAGIGSSFAAFFEEW
jgi:hypothetical protein